MFKIKDLVRVNGFAEPGYIIHLLDDELYEIELIHGPIVITGKSSIEKVEKEKQC
jgi:hypothetical protein